jgi:rod shape-determining protein MreD
MSSVSYTSRREVIEQSFPFALIVIAPLIAIGAQAYLPLRFPKLVIFDLPLIVTLYFAISRRSPVVGTITGTAIGLLQDALTHLPLGINGVAKAVVGYLAASVSTRLDVDSAGTRFLLVFGFTWIHTFIYVAIIHFMVGLQIEFHWLYQLLRAVINSILALGIFALLDLFRKRG